MTHALLVIDVQNDFCPGGALAVAGGDEIVSGINALMADYDAVLLTQDWHPAGQALIDCCRRAQQLYSERGINITQVAMQFAVSHQAICSTLVGTANPDNLRNNLDWIEQPLDQGLVDEIREIFSDCAHSVWPSGLVENSD